MAREKRWQIKTELVMMRVFSGTAGQSLADKTSEELGVEPGKIEVGRFADDEVSVKLEEDVTGQNVFVINPSNPPAENLMELAQIAFTVASLGAKSVTIIPTYLGYSRQDRREVTGRAISAKYISEILIQTGAQNIILIDIHSEPTIGFFEPGMTVFHVSALSLIPQLIEELDGNIVVVSPDIGGIKRTEIFAKNINLEFAFFAKYRSKPGEIAEKETKLVGNVGGKNVLLIDDMIDTGQTMEIAAREVKQAGANKIWAFATHAIFSGDAQRKLEKSPIEKIIVTDTIPNEKLKSEKIKVVSLAPLLSEIIKKIDRFN